MAYFHYRCGERITLSNENCTAERNDSDFDHGLVITAEPLQNDVLFEIKIDRKVNSWSGGLEIGVVECDISNFEFPSCASKISRGSWIMSSTSVFHNGECLLEGYGTDLVKLNQDDRVGLMRTSEGDLIFYINGESQGVAVEGIPRNVYGMVDLYGKCVQVTITSPLLREHNNDDCLSGSSMLAIDNDILNVTLGGDLSELSLSSSNSLDIRMDMTVSLSLPDENPRLDRLRFHDKCGSLVKLSNGNRTAERRRPLDEFNNAVVMTHRALRDSELFEIRIDRLVDKWSGSIEMGITTHNPSTLVFPATMTNLRSGTIMMSGCGILTNGKGTRREYGDYNLDELSEGDRVGMMRKPNGDLHYFINGLDQGIAAQRVPSVVWGVIDLYGMTIKVSIVERDEREEQNLMTRKNTRDQQILLPEPPALPDYYDHLTFHPNCGAHAQVINNGRTAHRPNAVDDFNNGVVLTARQLKVGELFEVRLDRMNTKWAGSIEIGVTTHSPLDLEFPFTMTNVRSGTWMMTGSGIMHNGTIVLEQYGVNLDQLQVGDRVGVARKENGCLHFFVNGNDQGVAAANVPDKIFGVIDLYGQAVEASIVDINDYGSPDTLNSNISNTSLYSDLRFHHVHGKNARITNNGLTALRPRHLAEFNDAIVFSNRPLRDEELFEICIDNIVDRWSGSIELGVTACRPDDLELPSTATDLSRDTWLLSGSSVMENGKTVKNNYPCDLDAIGSGITLGVMRTYDKKLIFYRNGVPQGEACIVTPATLYAVVDLYGQCAQVSIPCASPIAPTASAHQEICPRSDTSTSLQAINYLQQPVETDLHHFSDCHSKNVALGDNNRLATRTKDCCNCIVFSATPLVQDELYEVSIVNLLPHFAGTLCVGVTSVPPAAITNFPKDCCYITGNELRYKNKLIQLFSPSLNWLNIGDHIGLLKTQDNIRIFLNGEEIYLQMPQLTDPLYVIFNLRGSCSALGVISHKIPAALNSSKPQNGIELKLDQIPTVSDAEEINEDPVDLKTDVSYEFHDNHGRNIEISNGKTTAKRVASYNQGMVIVQPSLEYNSIVKIVIEQIDTKWQSSLIVGLASGPPEKINLLSNALCLKTPCCIVSNDWIFINGTKTRSNYGQCLSNLEVGDVVSVGLTEIGHFRLSVNDVEEEPLPCIFPKGLPIHAVLDLYGQCNQIKMFSDEIQPNVLPKVVNDCEKADLENCEKERTDNNNMTLPIASASVNNIVPTIQPSSPLKNIRCSYKEACEKFRKRILLPDNFFMMDEALCYCQNCYKLRVSNGEKDDTLIGWVKFPLCSLTNTPADKWHTAYYPTKLGNIRTILEKGQPLTKGQAQWGSLVCQREDDVQVVFYPSMQNFNIPGHTIDGKLAYSAFQLVVKPGAYSINREPFEWNTKETGAIKLQGLLIKLSA
ncbi:neuralized-like protein 4 [Harmonia axyridis]|uniref:neuralized-like protein 4 n=1 Tax=Harmonia axyridis TaxID=115357 RepID=UPI001E277053|nr:neuralized-like protein 4 [Harmonia axyridis]